MAPVATLMYMDLVFITFVLLEAHKETQRQTSAITHLKVKTINVGFNVPSLKFITETNSRCHS